MLDFCYELYNEKLIPNVRNYIAFFLYDSDGDGVVSYYDMQQVLKSGDHKISSPVAQEIYMLCDHMYTNCCSVDKQRSISFEEFQKLTRQNSELLKVILYKRLIFAVHERNSLRHSKP